MWLAKSAICVNHSPTVSIRSPDAKNVTVVRTGWRMGICNAIWLLVSASKLVGEKVLTAGGLYTFGSVLLNCFAGVRRT